MIFGGERNCIFTISFSVIHFAQKYPYFVGWVRPCIVFTFTVFSTFGSLVGSLTTTNLAMAGARPLPCNLALDRNCLQQPATQRNTTAAALGAPTTATAATTTTTPDVNYRPRPTTHDQQARLTTQPQQPRASRAPSVAEGARPLPCDLALGRNRFQQAAAATRPMSFPARCSAYD